MQRTGLNQKVATPDFVSAKVTCSPLFLSSDLLHLGGSLHLFYIHYPATYPGKKSFSKTEKVLYWGSTAPTFSDGGTWVVINLFLSCIIWSIQEHPLGE